MTAEQVQTTDPLAPSPTGLVWTKSSQSTGGAACVEVAPAHDGVIIRHSKHPDGAHIRYTRAEWYAFVAGVKLGEFDLL